ncbi:hypothetical protein BBJ41_35195 [Burkholderia stabilis]|nr:hypothetical protein BBJ41_35195 [Burkholderia stabilis]
MVETCKADGIEPYRYLVWLLQRHPLAKTVDDYDVLLPRMTPSGLRQSLIPPAVGGGGTRTSTRLDVHEGFRTRAAGFDQA